MIHPYVDGELDLATTVDIEMHMRDCAECAAAHRTIIAMRSSLRDGSL
jgi:anti-sigma factor RsiW